jgi:long-chain acyl-CoA synthetase
VTLPAAAPALLRGEPTARVAALRRRPGGERAGRAPRHASRCCTGWTASLSLTDDLGVDSLELLRWPAPWPRPCRCTQRRRGLPARAPHPGRLGRHRRHGLQHWDGELTFRTSGSTGEPKRCVHALAPAAQETAALAALFPGRRRCCWRVPAHHIYGFLFTVLLPRTWA